MTSPQKWDFMTPLPPLSPFVTIFGLPPPSHVNLSDPLPPPRWRHFERPQMDLNFSVWLLFLTTVYRKSRTNCIHMLGTCFSKFWPNLEGQCTKNNSSVLVLKTYMGLNMLLLLFPLLSWMVVSVTSIPVVDLEDKFEVVDVISHDPVVDRQR